MIKGLAQLTEWGFMMKKRFGPFVLLWAMLWICSDSAWAGEAEPQNGFLYQSDQGAQIGYARIDVLFDQYDRAKASDAVFQALERDNQTKRSVLIAKISAREASDDQGELAGERAILAAFDQTANAEMKANWDAVVRALFTDINGVIQSYAKAHGYRKIYDARMHQEGVDVTQPLLTQLNEQFARGVYAS